MTPAEVASCLSGWEGHWVAVGVVPGRKNPWTGESCTPDQTVRVRASQAQETTTMEYAVGSTGHHLTRLFVSPEAAMEFLRMEFPRMKMRFQDPIDELAQEVSDGQ